MTGENPRYLLRSLALILLVGWAGASPGQELPPGAIPEEPEEYDDREIEAYYDWRNDLFFRRFDMKGRGWADFMTARRTYQVRTNEFGNPVVLTMANPLFYWIDKNANGEFESYEGEMWADPEEDGVNGNEKPYDVHDLQSPGPPVYPFPPRSQVE